MTTVNSPSIADNNEKLLIMRFRKFLGLNLALEQIIAVMIHNIYVKTVIII